MRDPVVVIGVGQLGGVFARGFLRRGHPVVPVVRGVSSTDVALEYPRPALALVAVAEKDLAGVLDGLPDAWRDRVALIQNELLPEDWQKRGLVDATVMSVWFEKRPTFEPRVLRPSPAYGPHAALLVAALEAFGLPAEVVAGLDAMTFELVIKNVYILSKNAAGLAVGGTSESLWRDHADLARALIAEALEVQSVVTGRAFVDADVQAAVRVGFDGGPAQNNRGRSAPARVARAVALADAHGLAVPHLRRLHAAAGA